MPGAGGRDQRGPMERLVRLAAVLWAAGRVGVETERLIEIGGYDADSAKDLKTQLLRDLRHLERQGWQITNVEHAGQTARYRMDTVDNRLRVRLTPDQTAALQRAALAADRVDLLDRLGLGAARPQAAVPIVVTPGSPGSHLETVLEALRSRCRVTFRYKGTQRVVHPQSLKRSGGTWYLVGVEQGGDEPKYFVVSRMSGVSVDTPGTARRVAARPRTTLDPMSWQVDPPTDVHLEVDQDFVDDVVHLLGEPTHSEPAGDGDDEDDRRVRLTYTVTHRAALRDRLYELGLRVRLVGPADVRDELLAELESMTADAAP